MKVTEEKTCLCALNRIFGFKPRIGSALIAHFGGAKEIFLLSQAELSELLGNRSSFTEKISEESLIKEEKELTRLADSGIYFTGETETGYPSLLKECEDHPIGLYIRSDTPAERLWHEEQRRIAVVGTRDISPYGREWCSRIVSAMASCRIKPMIVSGLALGTDICAHTTALNEGIPTIGVMATGPDSVYPQRHSEIARLMARTPGCALISDYPPGTAPLAIHFLRRNRIIAGLSEATILVESRIKGGGMMTARLASSYNRDVYSLPGRIDDIRSQGCNELLRNNIAAPITSIESFITAAGLDAGPREHSIPINEMVIRTYSGKLSDEKIDQTEKILTAIYNERGITIEEIGDKTGIGYARTSELTGILELDSIISIDLLQRCSIISGFTL